MLTKHNYEYIFFLTFFDCHHNIKLHWFINFKENILTDFLWLQESNIIYDSRGTVADPYESG